MCQCMCLRVFVYACKLCLCVCAVHIHSYLAHGSHLSLKIPSYELWEPVRDTGFGAQDNMSPLYKSIQTDRQLWESHYKDNMVSWPSYLYEGNPYTRKDTFYIETWPWYPREQCSWGQHGAHLGPVGPRCAPCWPHEPCYQGEFLYCFYHG